MNVPVSLSSVSMAFTFCGCGRVQETEAKVTKKLAKSGQRERMREFCHSKVPGPARYRFGEVMEVLGLTVRS